MRFAAIPTSSVQSLTSQHLSGFRLLPVLACLLALITAPIGWAVETITVDPANRHQVIEGWEFTPSFGQEDKVNDRYNPLWLSYKDEVIRRMVEDMGMNRIRLEIKSGAENPVDYWTQFINGQITYTQVKSHWYEKINDNADPNTANLAGFQFSEIDQKVEQVVLPMKSRLEARGEKLFLNLNYIDFNFTGNLQGTLSHAKNPAEYVELIVLTFKHLQTKYGLVPDAFEIILEPDNTVGWRGAQIGNAIVAVVDALAAAGFYPQIIGPSNMSTANAITYFDQLILVPGALQRLNVISYHRYSGATLANVQALATRARTNGLKTGMLEWTNATIATLIQDLTVADNTAWQQWGAVGLNKPITDPSYLYTVDLTDPAVPVVSLMNKANLFQQVFKYVRAGATRIGATSSNTASYVPVAFQNADGGFVVTINNLSTAAFDVRGLPAGTYGITYSNNSTVRAINVAKADVTIAAGGVITVSGPAASGGGAITVFSKSAPVLTAPTIITQPLSASVTVGASAAFTVVATGNPAPTYQWRRNGVNISGATAASYITPATVLADSGSSFVCVVSNSQGFVTSNPATVTVTNVLSAPVISTQPVSASVTAGATAMFTVVATGNPAPTYQWQRNGANISGATSASYSTPVTVLADSGSSYVCVVSNSLGVVTSTAAILTVTVAAAGPMGHWQFDESSGLVAADASGNGGTGALKNMTGTWEPGQLGGALRFTGGTQLVQVPDSNALDVGTSFTLSAWIKPTTFGSYTSAGWGRILAKGSVVGARYDLCLNAGKLVFKGAASDVSSPAGLITLGVWQHVAVTYDGTTLRMYRNGVLALSQAIVFANTANTEPLYIGNAAAANR
ncbi:MAG: immunoglobulin domain-containing protein, partial [Planctomycetota bacterium]